MAKNEPSLESILDLNANNVWSMDANTIAELWENDKMDEDFSSSEDKLLNIIRLCFEVVHFNAEKPTEKAKYDNGEWAIFSHANAQRGSVAIRRKEIKRITDLSYENIHHVSAPLLLDLIDRNFGGGWDSLSLSIRDIIESGFEISTTTLPSNRLHSPGGTYERKVNAGFDVLEVAKGNWTEAIFAKKKEPIVKLRYESEARYDKDGNLIKALIDDDQPLPKDSFDDDDEISDDDTYYSSYSEEAAKGEDDEDGDLGGLNVEE